MAASGGGSARPDARTTLRYAAFQLPGFAVVSTGALAAVEWADVRVWVAASAVGLWVLKDALMFPKVWPAYAHRDGGGPHDLRDRTGTAEEALDPHGWIRVGAERWRARTAEDEAPIPADARVRVVAVNGLEATVVRADPPAGA